MENDTKLDDKSADRPQPVGYSPLLLPSAHEGLGPTPNALVTPRLSHRAPEKYLTRAYQKQFVQKLHSRSINAAPEGTDSAPSDRCGWCKCTRPNDFVVFCHSLWKSLNQAWIHPESVPVACWEVFVGIPVLYTAVRCSLYQCCCSHICCSTFLLASDHFSVSSESQFKHFVTKLIAAIAILSCSPFLSLSPCLFDASCAFCTNQTEKCPGWPSTSLFPSYLRWTLSLPFSLPSSIRMTTSSRPVPQSQKCANDSLCLQDQRLTSLLVSFLFP